MFNKLNLQTKIVSLALVCVILPTLVILTATYLKSETLSRFVNEEMEKATMVQLENTTETIRENVFQASRAAIISTCTSIASNGQQMVRYFYNQYKSDRMTEAEAKEKAASYLLRQGIGQRGLSMCWAPMEPFWSTPTKA